MSKIAIAKPIGSVSVGDVIEHVGLVTEVYAQGDRHIRICQEGVFSKPGTQVLVENVEVAEVIVESAKEQVSNEQLKPRATKIAREKKNKQILDESPNTDEKMILRG